MSRKWLLRQIELFIMIVAITEIWRIVSITAIPQDIIADTIEFILLVAVMLFCLFTELRLRQRKGRSTL